MLPLHAVEILEYLDWKGRSPYAEWFESLSAQAAAKVAVAIVRLGLGNFSNVKGVGGGVLRVPRQLRPRLPGLSREGRRAFDHPARWWNQETAAERH
jgi:hypothetical protein